MVADGDQSEHTEDADGGGRPVADAVDHRLEADAHEHAQRHDKVREVRLRHIGVCAVIASSANTSQATIGALPPVSRSNPERREVPQR